MRVDMLFHSIEEDIKKHKANGLTSDEIALLPPLEIKVNDIDFIETLVHTQKSNEVSYQEKLFVKQANDKGLVGKVADQYVKMQIIIWQRHRHEQAIENAKILGSTMQQLLPEIFEDKRAIPNCFLRGALFGMVRKGRRSLVENQPIFTMSQYKVSFSGSEMDQNDLELWDTLMYLAKNRQVNTELRITLYDLCQQMRLTDAKNNYERLTTRAKRLAFGKVSIKTDNKEYFGSLLDDVYIDNEDGKLVIRYNKKLAPLFIDGDYTLISADIRHLLGDNQLARWLYNFYETHNQPLPFTIDFIQKLCRSDNSPKDFKYKLKIALELVKKAHLSVNLKSKWDYELTTKNYLLIYPTGKTKKQIELFTKF